MQHTVLAEVNTPLQQDPAGHDSGNGLHPHMQFTAAPSFVAHAFLDWFVVGGGESPTGITAADAAACVGQHWCFFYSPSHGPFPLCAPLHIRQLCLQLLYTGYRRIPLCLRTEQSGICCGWFCCHQQRDRVSVVCVLVLAPFDSRRGNVGDCKSGGIVRKDPTPPLCPLCRLV